MLFSHVSGTRAAETGEYYTINGAALVFSPSEEGAGAVVGEVVGAIRTVAAFTCEQRFLERYESLVAEEGYATGRANSGT